MNTFLTIFPYLLTSTALIIVTVFSAVFMLSNRINDLRTWLALALTDTFIVLCIGTFALIVAAGSGTMKFEADFLKWLGGATIAEVAGIVLIVFRFFFHADGVGAVEEKTQPNDQQKDAQQQGDQQKDAA